MTFNEAVAYLTQDGETLLDALTDIADELEREEDDIWLTPKQIAAYRIVCAKMRPLFA